MNDKLKDLDCRYFAGPVALEKREGGDEEQYPNIAGYGAVFYNPEDAGTEFRIYEDYVERIMPGAFSRALKDGDDCRCFFNHDQNYILGRTVAGTLKLSQDAKGLRYEVDPPENQVGKYVTQAVGRGDVSGSSFMFIVDEANTREERRGDVMVYVREIQSVTLFEVGPVVFPAYPSATAQLSSRSMAALQEFRSRHSGPKPTPYLDAVRAIRSAMATQR